VCGAVQSAGVPANSGYPLSQHVAVGCVSAAATGGGGGRWGQVVCVGSARSAWCGGVVGVWCGVWCVAVVCGVCVCVCVVCVCVRDEPLREGEEPLNSCMNEVVAE